MPLLQMTNMHGIWSLAAVHKPWMVIIALPSPMMPNTGRPGWAHCVPMVAPMPPPIYCPRTPRMSPRSDGMEIVTQRPPAADGIIHHDGVFKDGVGEFEHHAGREHRHAVPTSPRPTPHNPVAWRQRRALPSAPRGAGCPLLVRGGEPRLDNIDQLPPAPDRNGQQSRRRWGRRFPHPAGHGIDVDELSLRLEDDITPVEQLLEGIHAHRENQIPPL